MPSEPYSHVRGALSERLPIVTYTNLFQDQVETVWMSPQVERITGYRSEEWVGHPGFFESVLHPDDRDEVLEELRASRAELRPFGCDYRLRARDGRTVWIHDESLPIFDAAGRPELIQGYFVDVSERKELERQLAHSQRLEALGRLAGMIAHDFNNLLVAIGGYAELALHSLADEDVARRHLREVGRATERGTMLTRQLLAFGRAQALDPHPVFLDRVLLAARPLLEQAAGEGHRLTIAAEPVPLVQADVGQFERVLVNLVANARDATPAGGTISVGCAPVPGGDAVALTVSDTGAGMDDETKEHIFDPFFTTKERDMGTGLGLSIVAGIVGQSGGTIEVESSPGSGAVVRIVASGRAGRGRAFRLGRLTGVSLRRRGCGSGATPGTGRSPSARRSRSGAGRPARTPARAGRRGGAGRARAAAGRRAGTSRTPRGRRRRARRRTRARRPAPTPGRAAGGMRRKLTSRRYSISS